MGVSKSLPPLSEVKLSPSPAAEPLRFRPDIDGLRAVAILAVVLFHAGVPGFSGGFVGVDVFFVVSGFLITRKLLADTESTSRVHLGDFWARRVRRLMPALSLMAVATLGLSLIAQTPIRWAETATEGVWAALYSSNIYFAGASADYFGGAVADSPFLHTWSLAVEEQFYLLWPILFVAWAALARRGRTHSKRLLVLGLSAIAAASFAASVVLTTHGHPIVRSFAFYGLPTRAWEFAAAGLLAAAPTFKRLQRRAVVTVLWFAGERDAGRRNHTVRRR